MYFPSHFERAAHEDNEARIAIQANLCDPEGDLLGILVNLAGPH